MRAIKSRGVLARIVNQSTNYANIRASTLNCVASYNTREDNGLFLSNTKSDKDDPDKWISKDSREREAPRGRFYATYSGFLIHG